MNIEIRWLYIGIFVCFFMFSDYSKSLTRISHSQALSLNFQPYLAGGPHGALAMDALHQRWKRCIETTRKTMVKRTDVETWNTRWSENCGFIVSSWLIVIVSVGPPFCTVVWEATGGNLPEEPAVTPKLSKSAAWHVLPQSPVRSGCGLSLAWWHCWVSWFEVLKMFLYSSQLELEYRRIPVNRFNCCRKCMKIHDDMKMFWRKALDKGHGFSDGPTWCRNVAPSLAKETCRWLKRSGV